MSQWLELVFDSLKQDVFLMQRSRSSARLNGLGFHPFIDLVNWNLAFQIQFPGGRAFNLIYTQIGNDPKWAMHSSAVVASKGRRHTPWILVLWEELRGLSLWRPPRTEIKKYTGGRGVCIVKRTWRWRCWGHSRWAGKIRILSPGVPRLYHLGFYFDQCVGHFTRSQMRFDTCCSILNRKIS